MKFILLINLLALTLLFLLFLEYLLNIFSKIYLHFFQSFWTLVLYFLSM